MSKWATRDLPRPSAFIQWKGTDVCMDVWCSCGRNFHIDSDFAYAVQCRHCEKRFEMSAVIEMREIPQDEDWNGCPILSEVVDAVDGNFTSSHTEAIR
jgi:hypothetical protein